MTMETAIRERDEALQGPVAQSVKLAFRALYLAVIVLAVVWATGNIRPVPSDSRAVVLRFGKVDRVKESGLLIAWPKPIEEVQLLPARERQLSLRINPGPDDAQKSTYQAEKLNNGQKKITSNASPETDFQITPNDDVIQLRPYKDSDNGQYFLTGDGSAVQLDTTVYYEITNPAAYMIAQTHVLPALRRLYLASGVQLAASRDLDDFLVARPDDMGNAANLPDASARRLAIFADMVSSMNKRLADLRREGTDLGVEVSRVDIVALLPPVAKNAFDDVLTATQTADQGAAAARTDAARTSQEADQQRDQLLAEAKASAEERVRQATTDTATIVALEARTTPADRADLLAQTYHDRIGAIMHQIGGVTAIDTRGAQHLIVPGPGQ